MLSHICVLCTKKISYQYLTTWWAWWNITNKYCLIIIITCLQSLHQYFFFFFRYGSLNRILKFEPWFIFIGQGFMLYMRRVTRIFYYLRTKYLLFSQKYTLCFLLVYVPSVYPKCLRWINILLYSIDSNLKYYF